MAAKESLRNLIREGDALKKEVDAFAVESQGVIEDMALSDRRQRLQKLLQRSKDLIKKATKTEQSVSKHTKGKEPTPINRFDEVKTDELKRLRNIKNRLEKLKDSLVPDETEEEYFLQMGSNDASASTGKKVISANSTLEDDDDDEEKEEEEEEEEEEVKGENNDEEKEYNEEEKNPSPKSGSKLNRLSLFRRSSKSAKDAASKPKQTEDSIAGGTKKEKKDREKQERLLEKEKLEQAKREKREQEKLEKLEKEQRENERKVKEQKKRKDVKKGAGKGKKGRIDSTLEGISERSEEEEYNEVEEDKEEVKDDKDDDGEVVQTKSSKLPKQNLKSPFGRKQKTSEVVSTGSDLVDEPKSAKERKGGSVWKLFQRKTDRKMTSSAGGDTKEMGTPVKETASKKEEKKKEEKKATGASKASVIEDEVDEEDDEEEDDEDEDDEDEDEDDEVASVEDEEEEEDISGEEEEVEDEEDEVEDEEEEDEDEEEEDEGEDDEDDEDEEYEDNSEYAGELGGTGGSNASGSVFNPPDEGMERFQAVCDFDPEQTEDLGFKQGDVLTVINTREDGWWMAEDEEGNRGLVPSTYLKLKKDYTDLRDLQSPEHEDEVRAKGARQKSGVQLWKGLRKTMNETSVTDVLSAMGAIPSGFRPSTTAKLLKDDQYTLCHVLKPHLSQSNLAFKDIFWNPQENQIRALIVRVQKMISIVMIKNMPQVGAGLETKNRHIRLAVFDGEKVLSNIHTVQATHVESDPKTWKFSPKMAGMLPSSLDGDCFVRTAHTDRNIGLLFEICLSYLRTKTGDKGEFSCGWVHLPLFDENTGAPIANKVYDLPIKGGMPYEQDVDVDPAISRKASSSKFRTMMTTNKLPRLVVKLITPTKEQKADLDTLPDTVVSSACYVSMLSWYRKLLADALLIDRINLQNTDLIHSPVLANLPKATKYPDIMDALRSCWADKKRTMKKSEKRDLGQMKKLFSDACMESVYPLLHSATLPPYKFGDTQNDQERWEEISSLMKGIQGNGILHYLLKPGVMHMPIDITEVTFDLLEVYHEGS